jgi:hypothetical protein
MTPKPLTLEEYMVEPRHKAVRSTPIEGSPAPYEAGQAFKSDILSEEALSEYQKILFSNWGYPERPTLLSIPASPEINVEETQARIDQLLNE